MEAEVWQDDESITVLEKGQLENHRHLMVGEPKLLRTIYGETWDEIMAQHHKTMGWPPYQPVADKEPRVLEYGSGEPTFQSRGEHWHGPVPDGYLGYRSDEPSTETALGAGGVGAVVVITLLIVCGLLWLLGRWLQGAL